MCSFEGHGRLTFLWIAQFQQERKKLGGCRCKVRSLGRLDEARLRGILQNLAKCGISGINVNSDRN